MVYGAPVQQQELRASLRQRGKKISDNLYGTSKLVPRYVFSP